MKPKVGSLFHCDTEMYSVQGLKICLQWTVFLKQVE